MTKKARAVDSHNHRFKMKAITQWPFALVNAVKKVDELERTTGMRPK